VITPVMLNGRLLADGGILNPVPIAPTAAVHADHTIAVSLAGDVATGDDAPAGAPEVASAEPRPVEEWTERFRRSAANLLDRDAVRSVTARFGTLRHDDQRDPDQREDDQREDEAGSRSADPDAFEDLPAGLSKFDIMSQSLDAMQSVLGRYRMAGYPPDVLVSVPKDACRSLDFHRAEEMIALGRKLTEAALDGAGLISGTPPEGGQAGRG